VLPDIGIALGAMVLVGGILTGAGPILTRLGAAHDIARKIPHALCGLLVAVAIYWVDHLSVVLVVLGASTVGLAFAVERRLIPAILEGNRARDYGFVGFALGLWIAAGLFWPDRHAVAAGALTLGLADSAAAVIGARWGRHRVRSSGVERSLEGALAFAVVAFLVAFGFLELGLGAGVAVGAMIAAFVAVTTASIELLAPSAADNLLITPWVALSLDVGHALDVGAAMRWLVAVVLAYALTPLVARLRWLDLPGAIAAAFVAAAAVALGGWAWIAPVAVFFMSSSILSRYRWPRPAGALRGLRQVVVNGVVPVLPPVIGFAITGAPAWFWMTTGAVAAANADTWATEIGRLSPRRPVSLRTFQRVATGTSGAVSLLGFVATVLGGLVIGMVGSRAGERSLLVVGVAAGTVGSLVDSVLGATIQGRFFCPACEQVVEQREHCGTRRRLWAGIGWVDNDVVNALANVVGMVMALMLFTLA
jgi:uncharacterized protein (TIGR00297 family)